jgi:hypothetical protein
LREEERSTRRTASGRNNKHMAYRWPSSVLTQRSLIVAVAIIVASVLSLAIASAPTSRWGGDHRTAPAADKNSSSSDEKIAIASSTAAASSAEIFTKAMDKMRRGGRDDADGVVEYVEVPSGEGGTMRYAAYLRRGQTTTVMSVRSWMALVASTDGGTAAACGLSVVVASSPYQSLLFETPGTTWSDSERVPFEFALVDMPPLGRFAEAGPDRGAFAMHFDEPSSSCGDEQRGACSFENLGGDAMLVSPVPREDVADDVTYSHLARFAREAPESQVSEFWRLAASTYLDVLRRKHEDGGRGGDAEEAGTWFSTNGMGVAWLHLRIDDRPKYYSYAPFRTLGEE